LVRQLREVGDNLLEAQPHVLALGKIHRIDRLTPLTHGSPGNSSGDIEVAE